MSRPQNLRVISELSNDIWKKREKESTNLKLGEGGGPFNPLALAWSQVATAEETKNSLCGSYNKYLLSTHYVPAAILCAENVQWQNKKRLCLPEAYVQSLPEHRNVSAFALSHGVTGLGSGTEVWGIDGAALLPKATNTTPNCHSFGNLETLNIPSFILTLSRLFAFSQTSSFPTSPLDSKVKAPRNFYQMFSIHLVASRKLKHSHNLACNLSTLESGYSRSKVPVQLGHGAGGGEKLKERGEEKRRRAGGRVSRGQPG